MKKTVAGLIGMLLFGSALLTSGCSRAQDKPLTFLSAAPWGNVQKAEYEIDNGNQLAGTAEIDIQKSTSSNVYKIIKVKQTGDDKIQSEVTIQANSLMPVDSYYDETADKNNFTVSTSYRKKWNVKVVTSGKEKNIDVKLLRVYYDNESLLVILGALSYEKGQTFKLNDAIPLTVKVKTISGKVEGQETITVPYGKAECDKIDLESMQLWYSADKNRILYQYKDGDITFKLKSLTRN